MEGEVRIRRKNGNKTNNKKNRDEVINEIEKIKEIPEDNSERDKRLQRNISDEPENSKEETKINKHKSIDDNRTTNIIKHQYDFDEVNKFSVKIEFDFVTFILFVASAITRFYKLSQPKNVVFDELHYGKYVSLYMKNTFFFDQHPPLGKQLIAGLANAIGYNGNYTFTRIGADYTENVPIFWLRFLPALCGSLLSPLCFKLLCQLKVNYWIAALGGVLIIVENALLTQSRFILMESMLFVFSIAGVLFLLKAQSSKHFMNVLYSIISAIFFTCALSIKYVGFYTCCLGGYLILKFLLKILSENHRSKFNIFWNFLINWCIFTIVPAIIYLSIFYAHFNVLIKAGPHDSIMTSAFQASLEGGLASITKGQPLNVVHGSQITLRHTHGRACWLHSHTHFYPIKYTDKRGSSHQQQVTCYSFKDVNNWWIVKRPEKNDLVVGDDPDPVLDGEVVQLIHGITSRALNSHDVAAPMTPQCQEVSCYVDYNISMPAQNLWRVEIINKNQNGSIWHAITSHVRLVHVATDQALKFTGKQLPDWGFNQHEVAADRVIVQTDTIWNVEEHRYTKTDDQKERERQMLNAEMIPTRQTKLSFWAKFVEVQMKMIWFTDPVQNHMYSSEPLDWLFMNKGIAYWVDKTSNAQIHLLGNIVIWYSATASLFIYLTFLIFYLLRRRRLVYDISEKQWEKFCTYGEIFFTGFLMHYLPYFFVERTLFLHSYLPAYIYKILLLCCVVDHIYCILRNRRFFQRIFILSVIMWLFVVVYVFKLFLSLSYGTNKLTPEDVINLRWKDTWDFILHKDLK